MLSVSGHKIQDRKEPVFICWDKVKIHPYIHGGGQQQGMRSGTENVPGLPGFLWRQKKCMQIWRKIESTCMN